jgi:ferric-dicitrate binding protein FerR (iron transport regulator)
MNSSSGNHGDGTSGMREANKDVGKDSQRALTELLGTAREAFGEDLSAREQAGLVRFEQTIARRTLRATPRLSAWAFGFGVVAAGATAAVMMMHRSDASLTFAVVNGTVSDGGYVRAKPSGGTELRFSDGSSLALDPGTSTRVTDIDTHGSRVLLESGRAHVRVTHRPAAKWTIDAGPYSVQVVGTEFDVRWSGSDEVLDVQMHRGAIIVRGPLASGGLRMEAGQHLVANVKDGEIFLDATPGSEAANLPRARAESPEPTFVEPEAPPAVAPTSPTSPAHVTRVRPGAARPVPAPGVDASWSKLIAQGDFQGVLADAEQRGLARTLDSASAADLNALADAARYVRRSDVARRTLLAERERFPRSVTAREAAFFLGGLAEDESGAASAKTALEWYERYMADSPRGTYAAQALGRQMILVHKLRGAAAARPIATEYLARFPSGPYAEPAKKLLQD